MRTESVRLLRWPELAADAGVSARYGGVSAGPYRSLNLSFTVGDDPANVLENRRRLAAAFGARPDDFVFARQVHGATVAVAEQADRGRGAFRPDDALADVDALVTVTPGVVLAILTADCVPVVLHDASAGVLGCVHAGWRGTAAQVAAATVAMMVKLGARPETIVAGIGPAIDPAVYQVGPEVRAALGDEFARPDPRVPGRWLADLPTANRWQLIQAGVREENIHATTATTGTDFFSDRARRPCGRIALVARLPRRAPELQAPDPMARIQPADPGDSR